MHNLELVIGINLGSGKWNYNDWIGYDTINGKILDKKTILPHKDDTIKYIYSSHFFEHINDDVAINLLEESYRILKKGGIVRITTPNYEEMYNRCKNEDINWFVKNQILIPRKDWDVLGIENNIYNTLVHYNCNYHDGEPSIHNNFKLRTVIPIININIIKKKIKELNVGDFCNWCLNKCPNKPISDDKLKQLKQNKYIINFVGNGKQHINWWTYNKFKIILEKIGFVNIKKSKSNKSSISGPFINPLNTIRGEGSLWIECQKL